MKPIHLLRYGLPAAITVVGIVFLCIGGSVPVAVGVTAIGIAVMVFGVNLFARMTNASQDDRDREEAAREYYARTGRWPDPRSAKSSSLGVAGPAGLPLAKPRPASAAPRPPAPPRPPATPPAPGAPVDRGRYDPGHRAGGGAGGSRRGLAQRRRGRRPD